MTILMKILLSMHVLQFIFIRHLYDKERKINTKHVWIWGLHILAYLGCGFIYFNNVFLEDTSKNEARIVWIPMDFMLTIFVGAFFIY